MATPFNASNPPDTESVKLGAERIRTLKSVLNLTLGRLFTLSTSDSPSATVSEVANSVSGTMLQNDASVDGSRAVNTNHIRDSAVTAAKIAADAVVTAKILDANVTTAKLADSSVSTVKIAELGVTTAKLADGAVLQGKIGNGEVASEKFTRPRRWLRYHASEVQLARSSNVVTATFADNASGEAHGILAGDRIVISGASDGSFNGTFTVSTVGSPNNRSLTYSQTAANASGVTGATALLACSFSLTGSPVSISTMSGDGTTVTVVTGSSHGLSSLDRVRISGATSAAFNGEFFVTVTNSTTFTFLSAASGSASGTMVTQKLAADFTLIRSSEGVHAVTFASALNDTNYTVAAGNLVHGGASPRAVEATLLAKTGFTISVVATSDGSAQGDAQATVEVIT